MSADTDATTAAEQHPAGSPQVRGWSILFALLLLALAGVLIREAVVIYASPAGWEPWIAALPEQLVSLDNVWVGVIGVAAVILGILLIIAAFKPRRRRYERLEAPRAPIWARPVDIARYTTSTAKRVPGVLAASTYARKKKVKVQATVVQVTDGLEERITSELDRELERTFGPGFTVTTSVRPAGVDDGVSPAGQPEQVEAPETSAEKKEQSNE
ncbi:hypothetical protein C3B44_01700 [Corynebacterium yudongzhengii]|uniref:DUF6286 domain-containing protein n=1 Tax=Corynebacterium yudongzhengii TaxID=2080740 RepID=A0A2U1T9S9_9CORY|nr:DUF6286 domain-containing protein [Corynebacterium yudongzhengii]AWB81210.1 hypothetical protein C3B44_01700 [Corynebacterium yudongzhengii]PWC02749.1 hypothetical protein DF222_00430 [Corynebacterium yudongzhengii]